MKVRFWGVRGSIASPGPHTVRHGGNTTCIEIRSDADELIILDAGTGIFPLSQSLLSRLPVSANIFITHTHWDHIQGLPFFIPLFIPGNKVRIHGAYDFVSGQGIEQIMNVQMQYSFFPVREAELKATLSYHTLAIGEKVSVGDATVTNTLLNHPVPDFGYRVDCNGKSVFFSGDHEPWVNIYAPEDAEFADYQAMVDQQQNGLAAFLQGVDVLVMDCSYTTAEYPAKVGWGHGTFQSSLDLACRVGAKKLICTHHEPTRSDDELEKIIAALIANAPPGSPEIMLSREGMTLEW